MAISTVEISGAELVEGYAFSQMGTYSYAELVTRFGVEKANLIWNDIWGYGGGSGSGYGLFMDFGGTPYINSTVSSLGGSPASVSTLSDTALELAQSNELTASEVKTLISGQGALKTGTGTAKSASLMSLDVGVVGAAIAPILGVSLGVNLYENNPQFWTLLSQKLLPFCYPGTTQIPAWLDIVESALVPGTYEAHGVIDKAIYDTIKEWFHEEGYGNPYHQEEVSYEGIVDPLYCVTISDEIELAPDVVLKRISGTGNITVAYGPQNSVMDYLYVVSDSENEFSFYNPITQGWAFSLSTHYQYTKDGHTVYVSGTTLSHEYAYSKMQYLVDYSAQQTLSQNDVAYSMMYGDKTDAGHYPEGTSNWEGDEGSGDVYDKSLLYIKESDVNPGTYEVIERDGIEIALPEKVESIPQTTPQTKPENWPEEVDWPLTVDFPWTEPDGYEGVWPETMPWPLPENKPEWWPEEVPYPSTFPNPSPSINPSENPNPNQNTDPVIPTQYVISTVPGVEINPEIQTVPDPAIDPSGIGDTTPVRPNIDNIPDNDPLQPTDSTGETPIPVTPIIPLPFSSQNDGLISVYNPTDTQLKSFASWLWVTYADPSIDKLWNNPFDGVIGLMELYCTPPVNGNKNIRSGFLDSGVNSNTISRYTEINCGSITIPEYYGDYFDYSPYTKCYCYLPFIGIVELNTDDIVGHAVNITYKIDCYNGSCIALITVAKSTTVNGETVDYSNTAYQFSGNCAVELPLSGGSQASIRAGMIQASAYGLSSAIGGIVSGVAGNIGGAISQLGYGAANAVGSLVSAKSSVQHSGSFGSSFGAMGIKTPYIIVTRPKEISVINYNRLYGYPAHAMVTIGRCSGFLRVREVNVESSTATNEEKIKIEELLKAGVYV